MRLKRRQIAQIAASLLIVAAFWLRSATEPADTGRDAAASRSARQSSPIDHAFENRQSSVLVSGQGRIARLLADDRDGSRHQRFVIELDSGLTVLIAHNIDIAPRVAEPQLGGQIGFRGEYEWNDQGGVIHWTHHDPNGSHDGGWLDYAGRRYE